MLKKIRICESFEIQTTADFSIAGVDFAILAMADVAILTYGSYGTFGTLFGADKLAVYYPLNHPSHDETGVSNGLPRFKGIEWDVLKNKQN